MKNKTKPNYDIFSCLRAQYKSKSKKVFHEFLRKSESEVVTNPKNFWKWVSLNTNSHGIPNCIPR